MVVINIDNAKTSGRTSVLVHLGFLKTQCVSVSFPLKTSFLVADLFPPAREMRLL